MTIIICGCCGDNWKTFWRFSERQQMCQKRKAGRAKEASYELEEVWFLVAAGWLELVFWPDFFFAARVPLVEVFSSLNTLGPITQHTQKHGNPSRNTKLHTNSGESPISGTLACASSTAASVMKQTLVIRVTTSTLDFCFRSLLWIPLEWMYQNIASPKPAIARDSTTENEAKMDL